MDLEYIKSYNLYASELSARAYYKIKGKKQTEVPIYFLLPSTWEEPPQPEPDGGFSVHLKPTLSVCFSPNHSSLWHSEGKIRSETRLLVISRRMSSSFFIIGSLRPINYTSSINAVLFCKRVTCLIAADFLLEWKLSTRDRAREKQSGWAFNLPLVITSRLCLYTQWSQSYRVLLPACIVSYLRLPSAHAEQGKTWIYCCVL